MLPELFVAARTDPLSLFPNADTEYYVPVGKDILTLWTFLEALPDGSALPSRGRDWASPDSFTEWDYSIAVKNQSRLFFTYDSGVLESFSIRGINYVHLVHFALAKSHISSMATSPVTVDESKVVIIAHGWSELFGPDYPIIRTLERVAMSLGWKVVVPDFRSSYRYASSRARAERVCLLLQEIMCLDPKPSKVVMVGHSQGGAAASLACTDRVVDKWNVCGLFMVGSENPRGLDGLYHAPKVKNLQIVHAEGDRVIHPGDIHDVSDCWNVGVTMLHSNVGAGLMDCWGDDINHDFLAKDILLQMLELFKQFLRKCDCEDIVQEEAHSQPHSQAPNVLFM